MQFVMDKKMIAEKRKSEILIADRYFSTTLCYQTLEGIDMKMALDFAKNFEVEVPDAIFYLDVDPDIAIKRKHGEDKEKNFREKDFDFIRKTAKQYKMLVEKQVWGKWINIDGNKGIEEITKNIYNEILKI
jgi:thymidylate kinase